MKGQRSAHPATVALHSDYLLRQDSALAPPIHVSNTYLIDPTRGLKYTEEDIYSRYNTPTRRELEKVLGDLEGGYAVSYSSGLAAFRAAVDHIHPKRIFVDPGYFGMRAVANMYEKHNIEIKFFPRDFSKLKLQKGDFICVECPSNPLLLMHDIKRVTEAAHSAGALVLVDISMTTPALVRPLEHGADFTFYSATKGIGGHQDILAGILVTKSQKTAEVLGAERMVSGATLGSLETWLLLRSVRTLDLRLATQSRNACLLAMALNHEPLITRVWHTSLKSHPSHEIAIKQSSGHAPVLSVELKTAHMAKNLPRQLKYFRSATSFGGCVSTIDYRHMHDDSIVDTLLRVSVGLEYAADLIDDFIQALHRVSKL